MSKIEVPSFLKEFEREFSSFTYRWDYSEVFTDLMDLGIAFFKPFGDKELGDRLKKKYGKEYTQLCVCFNQLIKSYQAGLKHREWTDPLGIFYESIASRSKSSRFGQFFTPMDLCDMLAMITIPAETRNKRISDPCSGSGRLLLASNSAAPNNYYYAADLDPICAKMTAINMCMHGLIGQVICANSLWLKGSWRFGFEVNATLMVNGFPSILVLSQEDCIQSKIFESMAKENQDKKQEIKVEKLGQLSLF